MPGTDPVQQVDPAQLDRFFEDSLIPLIVVAAILVAAYVLAPRFVRPAVQRALATQRGDFEDAGVRQVELEKRARTIEGLTLTLLRVALVATIGVLIIGMLGLWGILTGIGIFLAALTLAGQSIVLDYLMGILIVIEGTYFKGDVIASGDPSWEVAGTVEEVGLRRTVIRGPDGTVHSISNGLMRQVANRTRVYAAGEVAVRGIREEDFDRVLELMDRVGREVAEDPVLRSSIIEAPTVKFIPDPDDLGWSAIMRGKVYAGDRWAVGTAIRKRLNQVFLDEGIELNKRGVVPRAYRGEGGAVARFGFEPGEEG